MINMSNVANTGTITSANGDTAVECQPAVVDPFYRVSIKKFSCLFLLTQGLYGLYWLWRQWKQQRRYTGENLLPLWRTFLSLVYVPSLFLRIRKALDQTHPSLSWRPRTEAARLIAATLLVPFLNWLALMGVNTPRNLLFAFSVFIVQYLILRSAQSAANVACGDPQGQANDDLSLGNLLWICAGVINWGVTLFGVLGLFGMLHA